MKIASASGLRGVCTVPGDKSISHRAALIAAMADGISTHENFSRSQDCAATLACLSGLGVKIETVGTTVRIHGSELRQPSSPLDCGNSGSTMRMTAGMLASAHFETTLIGDASLSARPMNRIVEPLERMGAQVRTSNGFPPLHIRGSEELSAIDYQMPVASAQVKTAILLAGLRARGETVVTELASRTRDHTERMLKWFGVPLVTTETAERTSNAIEGPVSFKAADVRIPGDISSAAYLITAAALLLRSELKIEGIGLNPTRTRFLDVLRSWGADIEAIDKHEVCNEPVGSLRIKGGVLQRGSASIIRGPMIAELIDEIPLLAVVATQLPGGLVFRDAAELRVKETDRIAATVKNLRALGAEVKEFEDGLAVKGPVRLAGATLNSYGDHRIAMAFSAAALLAEGESEMTNAECVAVSFPGFFERLDSLVER